MVVVGEVVILRAENEDEEGCFFWAAGFATGAPLLELGLERLSAARLEAWLARTMFIRLRRSLWSAADGRAGVVEGAIYFVRLFLVMMI